MSTECAECNNSGINPNHQTICSSCNRYYTDRNLPINLNTMKDLRKEIEDAIYTYSTDEIKVEKLENICNTHADELADGFVEWADLNATQKSKGLWFSCPIGIKINNPITTAELLTIYKQTL